MQSVQAGALPLLQVALIGRDVEGFIDAAEDITGAGQAAALDLARGIP